MKGKSNIHIYDGCNHRAKNSTHLMGAFALRGLTLTDYGAQHCREAAFHDHIAESCTFDSIDEKAFFTAPTAMENTFILSQMEDLTEKCVLDLGAGTGEAAINFAKRGAKVHFCDISPNTVEYVKNKASHLSLSLHGKVCPAESLEYPDCSFDYIYANGVLHHVADRHKAYQEIYRVLRPGGVFFMIDPLIGNPAIWLYRRIATKMRSSDETPLTLGEIHNLAHYFSRYGYKPFWLLTKTLFIKYFLIDRVHPNSDRYWRRIYKETNQSLWWWQPLRKIDSVLTKLPLLNRWVYTTVFYGSK